MPSAVPIPPELVAVLKEHRERQFAERDAAGDAWQEHDLVFYETDGRHTSGTLLIEQGIHVRIGRLRGAQHIHHGRGLRKLREAAM